jgi:hypothetical protein
VIGLINTLIDVLVNIAAAVSGWLGSSPVALPTNVLPPELGYAAWFLPFSETRVFLVAIGAATIVWYGLRWLVHWLKVSAN